MYGVLMTTYRCGICNQTTTTDDDMPVCNTTAGCGFLFDSDIVPATTVARYTSRNLKFKVLHDTTFRLPGDETFYAVYSRGEYLGEVASDWMPGPIEGGLPVKGFLFAATDGRRGEGTSRIAAINDAFTS